MTLFEVALKASFNGYLFSLTRRFPSARICIWCNGENDIIEIFVRNEEEYPLVMEEIKQSGILAIVEESSDDRRICSTVHECHCLKENTIVRHIGKLDVLNIFPNIIEDGWSYHRLILFRHEDLNELLRRLGNWGWTYEILRKTPFNGFIASSLTITADALFSSLTEKQIIVSS